jgi:hypothetical protein
MALQVSSEPDTLPLKTVPKAPFPSSYSKFENYLRIYFIIVVRVLFLDCDEHLLTENGII